MKVDKKLVRIIVPFAPLAMIFAAIVLLGTVFLRAYDTGRPIPRAPGTGLLIAAPTLDIAETTQTIADQMKTSEALPSVTPPKPVAPVQSTKVRDVPPLTTLQLPEPSQATSVLQQVAEKLENTSDKIVPPVIEPPLETLQHGAANAPLRVID